MCCYQQQNFNVIINQYQFLMIATIVKIILFIASIIYYVLCFSPKRKYQKLKSTYETLGYKVLALPYSPFYASLFEFLKKNVQRHNDAHFSYKHLQGYDILLYNVFNSINLSFINPKLIKQFFGPQKTNTYIKQRKYNVAITMVFGSGLLFREGDEWKRKRKVLSKLFNYQILKSNVGSMNKMIKQSFDDIEKQYEINHPENKNQTYSFCVRDAGAQAFVGIVLENFLGIEASKEKIDGISINKFLSKLSADASLLSVSPLVLIFGQLAIKLGLTQKIRDFKRRYLIFSQIKKQMVNLSKQTLEEKKFSEETDKVIERVLMDDKKQDKLVSQETLRIVLQFAASFLSSGEDTSSRLVEMSTYYICDRPDIEARVRRQIQIAFPSQHDEINSENIKKVPYIDWVLLETTRMYGPSLGALLRESQVDQYLLDLPIPKGVSINVLHTPNHYDPKYFENPEQYNPERWKNGQNFVEPFVFGGFGGGPRTCLGKNLALLQSKIFLIELFRRYGKIKIAGDKNRLMHQPFFYETPKAQSTFYKLKAQSK